MKARVTVTLKTGILDPQGKAIEGALKSLGVDGVASVRQGKAVEQALHGLGWAGVADVRVGKTIEFDLKAADRAAAEAEVKAMCEKLLANTVIESYRVELA